MVVDDELGVLRTIKLALESEGFEVIEASSGKECLEKLDGEKPDLILLDVMMPKIDGWEVCKKIKENEKTASIPVVMLTVLSMDKHKLRSFDSAYADWHIDKFSAKEDLVYVVKSILMNPARWKQKKSKWIKHYNLIYGRKA